MSDKKIFDIKNWKLLSKKRLFHHPFVDILEKEFLRPDGGKAKFIVAERPGKEFFSVVVPWQDGKFYMVRQYRQVVERMSLEFPMGAVEGEKDPLEVAKQELKEELGIRAKSWRRLGEFYPASGFLNQKAYVFEARDLVFGEPQPEEDEFIEMVELPEEEFMERFEKGEIIGGVTLAVYFLWREKVVGS